MNELLGRQHDIFPVHLNDGIKVRWLGVVGTNKPPSFIPLLELLAVCDGEKAQYRQ